MQELHLIENEKKIVIIGGGTGIFPILSGLKKYFTNLTAIITMADDGGSTGVLREEFGILPPGDVRRAIIALSHSDNKILSELFNYRFKDGRGLAGHAFGNLMITALQDITGNFEKAIEEAGKILSIKGEVIPVTTTPTRLVAELENGQIIRGETNIDIPRHDPRMRIRALRLEPEVSLNPRAKKAIEEANIVSIGPGDLYTSILPNLLVKGMPDALKNSKAKIVYFVNVMTKFGETHGFTASKFVEVIEQYVGKNVIDYVAINTTKPTANRLKPYAHENSWCVEVDEENLGPKPVPLYADLIRSRGFIRHDPEKTAALLKLIS